MSSYRITKYNPKFRNKNGVYQRDDWTSISDIGKVFSGNELTVKEYIRVEDKYIFAIEEFLKCTEIKKLVVSSLEVNTLTEDNDYNLYSNGLVNLYNQVKEGSCLNFDQILQLSRLTLRENIWCEMTSQKVGELELSFGYDYYMYISTCYDCTDTLNVIIKEGLFVD